MWKLRAHGWQHTADRAAVCGLALVVGLEDL